MKILKPREEGYGFLVEYDSGFISPDLTCPDGVCTNRNLIKEFNGTIAKGAMSGNMFLFFDTYTILQKMQTNF